MCDGVGVGMHRGAREGVWMWESAGMLRRAGVGCGATGGVGDRAGSRSEGGAGREIHAG